MSYHWPALTQPKMSVVICNYNYASYIAEALCSIYAQTIKPHQVIVIDDGSKDDSVAIIEKEFPSVTLIAKENEGQNSVYNLGFSLVTGDIVLFLDSDDILLPNCFEHVTQAFCEDVVKVHYKMKIIDKNGLETGAVLPSVLDSGDLAIALISNGVLYKSPPASGNVYRSEALRLIFPIPVSKLDKHGADFFTIYGVALLGKVASINDALFKYRIHQDINQLKQSVGFGNAIKNSVDFQKVALQRWATFKEWIYHWSMSKVILPDRFVDFTQQKYFYALDMLKVNGFMQKLPVFNKHIEWLFVAIMQRKDFNWLKKCVALYWVLLLLITPSYLTKILARRVCNNVN